MSLHTYTLTKLTQMLRDGECSLPEIYTDIEEQITVHNKNLNIFLALNSNSLSQAKARKKLPLAGLPISVKDNFLTKDMPSTASAKILESFVPEYESTLTQRLKDEGGVIIGKTNLDAWAHGSSTETSDFGRTLNPRNDTHLPGGSSGGAAASIAADMSYGALCSETGGSIRQPAAWCGVPGLKPTYGRCSRYGIIAMASSTDSPGVIAKTSHDIGTIMNSIAGPDPYDGTTHLESETNFNKLIGKPIADMRIGYVYSDLIGLDPIVVKDFEKQLIVFEELGAKVEKVKALDPNQAVNVYTVVQRGEVSSNLARYDGIRYGLSRNHFGDEAKRRIFLGTYSLSKGYADKYYDTAQRVRSLFIQDYQKLFKKYDVLVSLSSPGYAKKIGATKGAVMFGELEDMLLLPSSITGLPGISVPCYKDPKTNLYLGMNIVAPMWKESRLIQVADAFEKATQWNSWSEPTKK